MEYFFSSSALTIPRDKFLNNITEFPSVELSQKGHV